MDWRGAELDQGVLVEKPWRPTRRTPIARHLGARRAPAAPDAPRQLSL